MYVEGGSLEPYGVKGNVWGMPWGHHVGLMSLLIIHEAYMPIYKGSGFYCGRVGQPEVIQEVLAKLKNFTIEVLKQQNTPLHIE